MTNAVFLLIALFFNHYLADFCLTLPVMIRAKSDGKSLGPILLHSAIHAVLMGACLMVYGASLRLVLLLAFSELLTHFVIDTSKARLSKSIPSLADARQKPYWMLYGLDQLLHQLVVIAIWYAAITLE